MARDKSFLPCAHSVQEGIRRRSLFVFEAPGQSDLGVRYEPRHSVFSALGNEVIHMQASKSNTFAQLANLICGLLRCKTARIQGVASFQFATNCPLSHLLDQCLDR